jgi:crossover junction endodeoxyribonuclease RuvC
VSAPAGVTVLGLDPGTRHFGWGVVTRVGSRLVHVAHGVVSVADEGPLGDRLVAIESALVDVLTRFTPLEVSIESMFYAKDASSASKLAHARGVGLLVAARAGMAVYEYPPARVKRTVTGAGRADKAQVAHMIRVMLGLAATPPADAADALAIAVTHLQGRALPGSRVPIASGSSKRAGA